MSRIKSVTCPNCGANLSVDENRDSFFCEYCGTKIQKNSNMTYVKIEHENRTVDEARLKEIELENKKLEYDQREKKIALIIWIVMMGIGINYLILANIFHW